MGLLHGGMVVEKGEALALGAAGAWALAGIGAGAGFCAAFWATSSGAGWIGALI